MCSELVADLKSRFDGFADGAIAARDGEIAGVRTGEAFAQRDWISLIAVRDDRLDHL